ncbi:sporulation protein polysaccharide deacetylase family [Mycoplasma sp. CAG:956]|nr:sporulation protein polysaccharide deacetylase family [Mycoplasma sp. CAG:956]
MKKYKKYILFSLLVLLSFYTTNKTANLVRNQDPILKEIRNISLEKKEDFVNAVIQDDYIIPGMYGSVVDELKSLSKMKEQDVFNNLYLVSQPIKPDISLSDNLDKIIIKGNSKKQQVSFVIDENSSKKIKDYLVKNSIKASLLITKDNFSKDSYFEQINNDFKNYKELDKTLKKNKINTNICVLDNNNSNLKFCKSKKKYLVKPGMFLDNANIIEIKTKLDSGSIIYIKDATYLDCLVEYIKSKDLKIVPLSQLISEK